MPPKGKNNNNKKGKSKKQAEADEFEQVLSQLAKATKAVGKERTASADTKKADLAKAKHENLAKTKQLNEVEQRLMRQKENLQFRALLEQLMSAQRPFGRAPVTDFHSETSTANPHFHAAVGEMQGWRVNMEDTHIIKTNFLNDSEKSKEGLFCVFDGHSGDRCAKLCRGIFPVGLAKHATPDGADNHKINFETAFLEIDEQIRKDLQEDGAGCTAVAVYVSAKQVTCASVGDSRAVLCRHGSAVALSYDHKPEVEEEKARIEAAGGFVQDNRVNGQLAMSRAMGDFTYKKDAERAATEQLVIAKPDVISVEREKGDKFIAVACDGIFDVLSNEELIAFIEDQKAKGMANVDICKAVCDRCLAPATEEGGAPSRAEGTDNMTIMIVDLN